MIADVAQREPTDELVRRAAQGDKDAVDRLFERLYPEVKRIAQGLLRGGRKQVEPTDVVNRVYEKVIKQRDPKWQDRAHFLRFLVLVIRRVIADLPSPREPITLSNAHAITDKPTISMRELLECLDKLEKRGKVGGRVMDVILMRVFTDWTWADIGDALGVSERTVKGDWTFGRAYLRSCLGSSR